MKSVFRSEPASARPRVLIYKRTHTGDPNTDGVFGCSDCVGRVREYGFDAVIGIGGISVMPQLQGIGGKVNWIGLGAHKEPWAETGTLGSCLDYFGNAEFELAGFRL